MMQFTADFAGKTGEWGLEATPDHGREGHNADFGRQDDDDAQQGLRKRIEKARGM